MDSTISMRIWRASKSANRPFPSLDDDEVVDYLILEALATKAATEEKDAQKKAKIEAWKKDKSQLREAL